MASPHSETLPMRLLSPEQRASELAPLRLDVDWPEQVDAHHLGDASGVVSIALVDLGLQKRLGMPRFDADHGHAPLCQPAEQPLRQRSGLETDTFERAVRLRQHSRQIFGMAGDLDLTADLTRLIENAHRCFFHRDVETCIVLHAALLLSDVVAGSPQTTFTISLKRGGGFHREAHRIKRT